MSKKSSKLTVLAVAICTTIVLIFLHHAYLHSNGHADAAKLNLQSILMQQEKTKEDSSSKSSTSIAIPFADNKQSDGNIQPSLSIEPIPPITIKTTKHQISPLQNKPLTTSSSSSFQFPSGDRTHLHRSISDYAKSVSWKDFVYMPNHELTKSNPWTISKDQFHICSKEVEDKLKAKLEGKDLQWCEWALSPSGGKVKVGSSYGTLNSQEREKYEQLNCNSVAQGSNPSCDDVSYFPLSMVLLLMGMDHIGMGRCTNQDLEIQCFTRYVW